MMSSSKFSQSLILCLVDLTPFQMASGGVWMHQVILRIDAAPLHDNGRVFAAIWEPVGIQLLRERERAHMPQCQRVPQLMREETPTTVAQLAQAADIGPEGRTPTRCGPRVARLRVAD